MTRIVPFPPVPRRSAAARRLALALAGSALIHAWLLATPLLATPWPAAVRIAVNAPLTVRLAPLRISVSDTPAVLDPETRRTSRRVRQQSGATDRAISGSPSRNVAHSGVRTPALPRPPDLTYYAARELDAYPRPAAPFELDRLTAGIGEGAAFRIRLALLIDEHGFVKGISVVEADPPGPLEEELRARLTATRFVPASKDGRAVRSRLVLSVSFAAAGEQ